MFTDKQDLAACVSPPASRLKHHVICGDVLFEVAEGTENKVVDRLNIDVHHLRNFVVTHVFVELEVDSLALAAGQAFHSTAEAIIDMTFFFLMYQRHLVRAVTVGKALAGAQVVGVAEFLIGGDVANELPLDGGHQVETDRRGWANILPVPPQFNEQVVNAIFDQRPVG